MGKLITMNIFGLSTLVYLRLINVLIGFGSLYLTYLLTKEITNDQWIQILVLIIQTNVLMYVFISSMVSYDNLVNLLSVASFLLLIRYLKNLSRLYLFLLIITMLTGVLVKVSYGPIVLIQALVLIYNARTILNKKQKLFNKSFSISEALSVIAIVILIILNIELYANNLIHYGQIQPKTANVIGHQNALNSLQYQRNIGLKSTIQDRPMMPFHKYFIKYVYQTQQTIFGILAHRNMLKKGPELYIYWLLFCLSLLVFIKNFKKLIRQKNLNIILFSTFGYMLVVLLVNYQNYKLYHLFGLALQGRYNFPVLALAIIFIAYNLLAHFNDKTKAIIIVLATILLVYNNYFWFLSHVTPDWYIK